MLLYLPIENEVHPLCSGQDRVFGLRILQQGEEQDEELMVLPCISTDFAFTLRLASLFTRKQISPLRLLNLLDDIL